GIIVIVAGLNMLGSKTGGVIQTVSTICKLIPLILIMVVGFIKGGGNNPILTPMVGEGLSLGSVLGQV
ncbi:amino acid permease, partial [Clostridioides difficile]